MIVNHILISQFIIQEDMKDFFPSIKEDLIAKAFQYYMNFSPKFRY